MPIPHQRAPASPSAPHHGTEVTSPLRVTFSLKGCKVIPAGTKGRECHKCGHHILPGMGEVQKNRQERFLPSMRPWHTYILQAMQKLVILGIRCELAVRRGARLTIVIEGSHKLRGLV